MNAYTSITIRYTATDAAGNIAYCTFNITLDGKLLHNIKFYRSNQLTCVRVSQYHCARGDETKKKRHLLKVAKGYRYTFSLSDGRGTIHTYSTVKIIHVTFISN